MKNPPMKTTLLKTNVSQREGWPRIGHVVGLSWIYCGFLCEGAGSGLIL